MTDHDRTSREERYQDAGRYDEREQRGERLADRGRERIADAFDDAADRIEHRGRRMRRRGGARAQAGRAAESAGRMLESGADYLRAHDIEEMKLELEARVREKPLPALVAAVVAGFVFARIVR